MFYDDDSLQCNNCIYKSKLKNDSTKFLYCDISNYFTFKEDLSIPFIKDCAYYKKIGLSYYMKEVLKKEK